MCTTCGCGAGETRVEGQALHERDGHWHVHADGTAHAHAPHADHVHPHRHEDGTVHAHPHDHAHGHDHPHHAVDHTHEHVHADGTRHAHGHHHDDLHHAHPSAHDHAHDHVHESAGTLDYGQGPARTHAPGMTQARMVRIERDILSKNDGYAAQNRQFLADRGLLALNFVSSPGSGKTTLLCRTIAALQDRCVVAVIEGDQQTANDADRIRATGAPAVQINTGKGCHLDAHMVGHALKKLDPADGGLLFIENVGNLVCPAAFDLGEACKVAILSVTEGEDKPLKYPDMFQAARLMLLNKVDLLPYLDFDVARAIDSARRVNPGIEVIQVSATSGAGMGDWLAWLDARRAEVQATQTETVAALRARVAALEAQLAARG